MGEITLERWKQGPFKTAVLRAVDEIPQGRVSSVRDIARALGYPAEAAELVELIVTSHPEDRLPWHRVVASDGSLPGASKSHKLKSATRLKAEGIEVNSDLCVDHAKFRWVPRARGPIVSSK